MEEAPLLGALAAEAELGPELFSDGAFKADDALQVLRDAYLGEPEPRRAPAAAAAAALGELDAAPAYSVHFLSSLLGPGLHRGPAGPVPVPVSVPVSVSGPAGPAVLPLGAWARDTAHAGLRVIPVELKEAGGTSVSAEEATFQNSLAQESCCKYPPSQEVEDASGCSYKKDSNPMLDSGGLPVAVNGPAFPPAPALPGPARITLAGYCDCFASGDFCDNLQHEIERFKAMKAKTVCPSLCKCAGCRNCAASPERKTLMNVTNYVGVGDFEGGRSVSPPKSAGPPKFRKDRASCISWEVVEAACACLLAQGEEAERERCPPSLAEHRVLEEFGRCLSQILHIEFKSRGLKVE
ncbi:tesmin [Erinaceus europaeus]|uniref:Tesmin n=1 Tax=Erinaceus europaeus TaxID=9365 RepID=A0ABM3W9N1_ERIEU|nr:tesmin [Erinaceus europaeus]XP_060033279.1 tesmin [Erinaceus europaeus]